MLKRDFFRNIFLVGLILVGLLCLRVFVFSLDKISEAESNSYLRAGDIVLVTKNRSPKLREFVQYEVDGRTYIGRVVAQQGDSVTYMDDIFYRNNHPESENYLTALRSKYLASETASMFTEDFTLASLAGPQVTSIPQENYLILNDNRQNMADSRQFGLIKKTQIKGVIEFRLLPLDNFGFIKSE
ncbi:signal peptidase I [Streptococcus cuniculipharyngis]|uniref:Signal peptidase I n=1 Tax=Streptococcus cuniculipharyngis TaxID=1562651 RepID=A0A5C5SA42_9STRE|nr:signal peptidase I [Streptococcus cuniculipharyngis]TWS96948.1 signal peptidase I [Streptococcus cuniculipharyngis]